MIPFMEILEQEELIFNGEKNQTVGHHWEREKGPTGKGNARTFWGVGKVPYMVWIWVTLTPEFVKAQQIPPQDLLQKKKKDKNINAAVNGMNAELFRGEVCRFLWFTLKYILKR